MDKTNRLINRILEVDNFQNMAVSALIGKNSHKN
jgi:hypothetical protein